MSVRTKFYREQYLANVRIMSLLFYIQRSQHLKSYFCQVTKLNNSGKFRKISNPFRDVIYKNICRDQLKKILPPINPFPNEEISGRKLPIFLRFEPGNFAQLLDANFSGSLIFFSPPRGRKVMWLTSEKLGKSKCASLMEARSGISLKATFSGENRCMIMWRVYIVFVLSSQHKKKQFHSLLQPSTQAALFQIFMHIRLW